MASMDISIGGVAAGKYESAIVIIGRSRAARCQTRFMLAGDTFGTNTCFRYDLVLFKEHRWNERRCTIDFYLPIHWHTRLQKSGYVDERNETWFYTRYPVVLSFSK